MERGSDPLTPEAAASVLSWWADAGVDTLIDEEPRDWLRPQEKAPPPVRVETRPVARAVPAAPVVTSPTPGEPLPDQLNLFQAWLKDSASLPYAAPAAPRVCPSGDPASGLMIMADMPTAEDCSANTLLSGDTGRLFDRMLAAIGRDRESVYLAALSCLRSPSGLFNAEGAGNCATLARHHIGLAAPRVVLLLGDACSKALLGLPLPQARGRLHEVATQAGPVKALVTLSPRDLLKTPAHKSFAWADLQLLIEELKS
jgi:DNA polymerase